MTRSPESHVLPTLPREARESIQGVFDALSEWRDAVTTSTERHSEAVLDKMAAAARAMGWPKELVDASHKHFVQVAKAQTHMIDQLMDAWEKQLSSPTPGQFLSQLNKFSGAGGFGATPTSSPFDLWMQTAEMWQRNWASALSMWTNSGPSRHH